MAPGDDADFVRGGGCPVIAAAAAGSADPANRAGRPGRLSETNVLLAARGRQCHNERDNRPADIEVCDVGRRSANGRGDPCAYSMTRCPIRILIPTRPRTRW